MRRGAFVTAAAVLVLAAAGCSEPQQANDTLPTASETSAEPTLEPLGPADFPVPDEAREQTEAGAEAMASYYLDLIDFARSARDADLFLDLANNCETCSQVAAGYESDWENGYTLAGGDLSIDEVGPVLVSDGTADLTLRMTQSASQVLASDGTEMPDLATSQLRLSGGMVFEWDPIRSGWVVTQFNAERY